jgi:hypothetical protein
LALAAQELPHHVADLGLVANLLGRHLLGAQHGIESVIGFVHRRMGAGDIDPVPVPSLRKLGQQVDGFSPAARRTADCGSPSSTAMPIP